MAGTAKSRRTRDAGVEPRKEESSNDWFQEEDDSSQQAIIHHKSEQEFTYPLPEDVLSKDEKQRKQDETYHQTKGLVEKRLEFMEKTHQIKYSDAHPSMNELFNTLMVSLQIMTKLSSSYIMHQITANPILSRMATSTNISLLDFACTCTNHLSLEAIKCLIAANPNALLWQSGQDNEIPVDDLVITKIAEHRSFCRLMPWIAINYGWIFNHELCLNLKELPMFSLLKQILNNCTSSVLEQFCMAYPNGLTQESKEGHSPLHTLLYMNCDSSSEAELFDIFKRLAGLRPSVMSKRYREGRTLLHDACAMLAIHGDNLRRDICKFLLAECPHLVKVGDNRSELPIHSLLGQLDYRLLLRPDDRQVEEVCVCLFRSYPDSYDMCSPDGLAPSSIPFAFLRMKTYLKEERKELRENINQLQEIANAFNEAQNDTVSTIFNSWASSLVEVMEAKVEAIHSRILAYLKILDVSSGC